MTIFRPRFIQINSPIDKQELLKRIDQRYPRTVNGDTFQINSEPYAFLSKTVVRGRITKNENHSLVLIEIIPDNAIKFILILINIFLVAVLITFIVKSLIENQFFMEIIYTLIFIFLSFLFTILSYSISVDKQEHVFRRILLNK